VSASGLICENSAAWEVLRQMRNGSTKKFRCCSLIIIISQNQLGAKARPSKISRRRLINPAYFYYALHLVAMQIAAHIS
jgi:hypothetical protein